MISPPLTPSPTSDRASGAHRSDLSAETLHRIVKMLRSIAGFAMARERADHTLQPTAVVNELLIRILTDTRIDFRDEPTFRAWASKAIRHHLIDHARRRMAAKRGGDARHLRLEEAGDVPCTSNSDVDLLLLTEALERLRAEHPRSAEVVTFKLFGGLSQKETADRLGVSERTVRTDWIIAKAWLYRELHPD